MNAIKPITPTISVIQNNNEMSNRDNPGTLNWKTGFNLEIKKTYTENETKRTAPQEINSQFRVIELKILSSSVITSSNNPIIIEADKNELRQHIRELSLPDLI